MATARTVTIRYTPQARDDLDSVFAYLEQQSPDGARNVARALQKTIDLIGQFPDCGRMADAVRRPWPLEQDEF